MAQRNTKLAIIGYTTHKRLAPWDDPSWDLAGLNDLYNTPEFRAVISDELHRYRVRWFQLHHQEPNGQFRHGSQDPNHLVALESLGIPIITWMPHPDLSRCETYPFEEAMALDADTSGGHGSGYFNNSVSWMIVWGILNGYKEISLLGIDMATDAATNAEYSHQRPSCEYWIGIARGMGITVTVPDECDLLKTMFLYGRDDIAPMRHKFMQRHEELQHKAAQIREQVRIGQINLAQTEGALGDVDYVLRTWIPDDGVVRVAGTKPATAGTRDELASGMIFVESTGEESRSPIPIEDGAMI
jgi:hypothetical protein